MLVDLVVSFIGVVVDNSSSLDEKKRLTQRQEIFSVSSQFINVEMRGERNGYPS
jgi:hypothetical protein